MAEIIGKKSKPKGSRVSSRTPTFSVKDIDKQIAALQSLGFKITPPTSEEDQKKLEESKKKLGFSDAVRKVTEVPHNPHVLKATLGTQHIVGGKVYGPGELLLPIEEEALFRGLIHQDALTRQSYLDTVEYSGKAKCFMIQEGVKKVEVSEAAFNGEYLPFEPAVTAGAMDIAGFNPNVQSVNRVF